MNLEVKRVQWWGAVGVRESVRSSSDLLQGAGGHQGALPFVQEDGRGFYCEGMGLTSCVLQPLVDFLQ